MIDILLEDTKKATTLEQLTEMQRLFKAYGQDKPKLLPIVNEDCAARGISSVYFKNLTSKKVISESKRIASLELWAPDIAGIKVKKKKSKKKTKKKNYKSNKKYRNKQQIYIIYHWNYYSCYFCKHYRTILFIRITSNVY